MLIALLVALYRVTDIESCKYLQSTTTSLIPAIKHRHQFLSDDDTESSVYSAHGY